MTLRFGTDGVRGPAAELSDHLVESLGRAAAQVLAPQLKDRPDQRFVIGRDTRESGERLEAALVRGLALEGVVSELTGVAPTPAVAWISAARDVPAAMISASHNAYHDNGIKFFAAGGVKLVDEVEAQLEASLDHFVALTGDSPASSPDADGPVGGARSEPVSGAADLDRYQLALVDSVEGRTFDGLVVVLDCANGAASSVAPQLFERMGATVHVRHAEPDGRNINSGCGSTHPDDLQKAVVSLGADVGLAFDGDADRVLAVDETGSLIDGDHLIAMCALDLRDRGLLARDTVVVTVMTNLGFHRAMQEQGIAVVETKVGDRYVLEALEREGLSLGGEQSGHVIFRELATTGDGILTGIQVLDVVNRRGRPLSALATAAMTAMPQILRNVTVPRRDPTIMIAITEDIAAAEAELGDEGRVLVRPSGTEPLVRVMVEASEVSRAERAAARLVAAVERAAEA
jgi:phosphoglucosamine mutase